MEFHSTFSLPPRIAMVGGLLLIASCASTVTVKPVDQVTRHDAGAGGLIYSLPKSVVVTEVVFIKSETTAPKDPDFAIVARLLFDLDPKKPSTTFGLGETKISLRTEKDDTRTYRARISQDPFSTQKHAFTFNKQGLLAKGESSSHNRLIEYAVTVVESAAKIAASGAKAMEAQAGEPERPDGVSDADWEHLKKALRNPKVQRALGRIKNLVDQKPTVMIGSSPNQLQLLEKIDGQIQKEMEAFVGKTSTEAESLVLEYTPSTDATPCTDEMIPLFNFRDDAIYVFRGYTGLELRSPLPVGLKFSGTILPPGTGNVQKIKLRIQSTPVDQKTAAAANLGRGKQGFFYCIPAEAKLDLYNGATLISGGVSTLLPQYGAVACLPASTGSEKTGIKVTLDPDTGGLLEVGVEAEAFDPKYVQRVGDAVNTVVDAQVEKHNREVKANDELTQLQRTKEILQLKSDIAKLQAEAATQQAAKP